MIFILRLLLISSSALLTAQFMPWWSILLCSILVSFILPGNNFNAFISGFLGIGLLWMIMAWKVDVETGSVISAKVVQLLPYINDSPMLIIATGVLGGIVGGFGAGTGNSLRQIFIKKKKPSLYS